MTARLRLGLVAAATLAALLAFPGVARAGSIMCGDQIMIGLDGHDTLTLKRVENAAGHWLDAETASGRLGGRCPYDRVDAVLVYTGDPLGIWGPDRGDQIVVLDMTGGVFAPGRTPEERGRPEIEFTVNLGLGKDAVYVYGTPGADNVRVGDEGINLNGDDDVDVVVREVESVQVWGLSGADVLSGAGGLGTGGAVDLPLRLEGGMGNDTLTGAAVSDTLSAGPGNDTIYARDGVADVVSGGSGKDRARVDRGRDRVSGVERLF